MVDDVVAAHRVVVHGQVQGVFFRASCRDVVLRLGLVGWVANRPDGTVLVHAEGDPGAVDGLVQWCRRGPVGAVVAAVDDEVTVPEGLDTFEIV